MSNINNVLVKLEMAIEDTWLPLKNPEKTIGGRKRRWRIAIGVIGVQSKSAFSYFPVRINIILNGNDYAQLTFSLSRALYSRPMSRLRGSLKMCLFLGLFQRPSHCTGLGRQKSNIDILHEKLICYRTICIGAVQDIILCALQSRTMVAVF